MMRIIGIMLLIILGGQGGAYAATPAKVTADTYELQMAADAGGALVWAQYTESGREMYYCQVGACKPTPIGSFESNYIAWVDLLNGTSGADMAAGNRADKMTVYLYHAEESENYRPRKQKGPDNTWTVYYGADLHPARPIVLSTYYKESYGSFGTLALYATDSSNSSLTNCYGTPIGTECNTPVSISGTPISMSSTPTEALWSTTKGVYYCKIANCGSPSTIVDARSSVKPTGNLAGIQASLLDSRVFGLSETYPDGKNPNVYVWSCPVSGCTTDSLVTVNNTQMGAAEGLAINKTSASTSLYFSVSGGAAGIFKCTLNSENQCSDTPEKISGDVLGGEILITGGYLVWLGNSSINILPLSET